MDTRKGNFTADSTRLEFPDLEMEQEEPGRRWTYVDEVCLPPRIRLKNPHLTTTDIVGELSHDCRKYK